MATLMVILAISLGGGSLLLFGVFLYSGPFNLVHLGWSEPALLTWDLSLSLMFFVQHSLMLRRGFRSRFAKGITPHYYGAVYAIVSGIALTVVVILWQTSSIRVYAFSGMLRWLLRSFVFLGGAGMGWGIYALRSFDPFGLMAIRAHERGQQLPEPNLVLRGPYLWVRHPLYLAAILLIWSSPEVNADRLLFNVVWTAWIYLATFFEETDLVDAFGEAYREYQRKVPRLLPWRLHLVR